MVLDRFEAFTHELREQIRVVEERRRSRDLLLAEREILRRHWEEWTSHDRSVDAWKVEAESARAKFEAAEDLLATELAAVGPAPVADSAGFAAVEAEVKVAEMAPQPVYQAPLIKAPVGPAKAAAPAPVKLALADVPAATPKSVSGSHVVQLGAFSSAAAAEKAWSQYSKRFGVLNGFSSASSTVTVNGKTLIRLAAMGFGNQATANSACQQIKSKGGDCLVRSVGGQQSVRMASAQGRRVAAR